MKNKHMRKDWQLGFFGFFALFAIPGLMKGEWVFASWLVWIIWFIFFIPVKDKNKSKNK